MREHTVHFVSSGSMPNGRQRWLEPLLAAWPDAQRPAVCALSVPELCERLAVGSGGAPTTVLAVLGPEESNRSIDALQESLLSSNSSGVFLVRDPEPFRAFQRHGVIFEGYDADPATLAGMLFGLAERQEAVDVLAREVALSQRCHGGIRNEMDKIHDELHLAAAVQREFTNMPLPTVPGLDIGVLFRPLSFVSGDVYWVRALDEHRLAVLIADAVGHGVPAALLTMVLTSSLVTHETVGGVTRILEPSEVLARLNRRLCESCLSGGRFVTGVYAVIDASSGSVTLAGAGHPHPVVLGPSGNARAISTEGPLLGVFGEAEFDQSTFTLASGESLVLYTDGLEAALHHDAQSRRADAEVCVAQLSAIRDQAPVPHAGGFVQSLHELLDMTASSLSRADDVTALCITATPAASVIRKAA